MKVLQIGLGSMGKRRVRNQKVIGIEKTIAFDAREDRRQEAKEKYGIEVLSELTESDYRDCDAMVISTPPDYHKQYIERAIEFKKPAFVEASVLLEGLQDADRAASEKGVLIAPSCTLRFHPCVKIIKELVQSHKYGKVTNFVYHMGQYLPDWHPWESIKDFYVGQKATSASREMVPFEMTWLTDVLGMPTEVVGMYGKTIDLGVDIDDSYSASMRFKDFMGTLVVDVVSRFATRRLTLNMEKAQIRWDWEDGKVQLYTAEKKEWETFEQPVVMQAEEGYNPNITETMYVDELRSFFEASQGKGKFPNTLQDDIAVLNILTGLESTNKGKIL